MVIAGIDQWIVDRFSSDKYEVTKDGRLISRCYKTPRVLKTHTNKKTGYVSIGMKDGEKNYCCMVHRIVALLHIPNPNGYSDVNHLDGNKQNNSVENLEWCNPSQNNKHAYEAGLRSAEGEKNGQSKLTEHQVKEIRRRRNEGQTYSRIAPDFDIHPMTVGEICRNELWRHVE